MKLERTLSSLGCAVLLGCSMPSASLDPPTLAEDPPPEQVSPPEPPAAPPAAPQARAPAPDTPAEPEAYRLLWTMKPQGGWASATVITPSGDVANISRDELAVHARDDGRVLESGPQCTPLGPRAMTVMRGKIYLACDEELRELTLPGLRYKVVQRGIFSGKGLFQEAAFGGDKVVYAHNDGSIAVYSTLDWRQLATHQLPKSTFSPSVAVSADGSLFTISDRDTNIVELFDGAGHHGFSQLEQVLAFNSAGTHVFGSPGSFRAAEAGLVDGQLLELARTGSWLTAGIYFAGDHQLAIAGSDGLAVKNIDDGSLQALSKMTAETLAVSLDGSLICGADRGTEISCFARGTIAPSTYHATSP